MRTRPVASIVMPFKDRKELLVQTLENLLQQTFSEYEIFLIDTGSTDGAQDYVKSMVQRDSRLVYIDNSRNGGLSNSYNVGIDLARGDFVFRMDSDDLCHPSRIQAQLHYFDENPDVSILGSWVRTFGDGSHLWKLPVQHEDITSQMLFCGAMAHPAVAFRKSRLNEFNLRYDESYPTSEDFELFTRASKLLRCANVPQVLLRYRRHPQAVTTVWAEKVRHLADKVLLRQLQWIGAPTDDTALRLHSQISHWERGAEDDFISRAFDWLSMLEDANRQSRRLDFFALRRQLDARRKWLIESAPVEQHAELTTRSRIFLADRNVKVSDPIPPYTEEIFNRLPDEGCRALSKWKKEKLKVGMAILIHERPEYLENCLTSVFQTAASQDYELTVVLVDDGSLDDRVQQYMELAHAGETRCVRVYTQKTGNNWGAAYNKAMKLVLAVDDFDVVGSSDSDALFHPLWLQRLLETALWAKQNHTAHRIGPLSGFNSSDDEFHEWQGVYDTPHGQFVVKKRMGALNYMFCIEDFKRIGFFPEHRDDETEMTRRFQSEGWWNFSTMTSYVEHLGQNSVLNKWRPTAVSRAVHGLSAAKTGWPSNIVGWQTLGYYQSVAGSTTTGDEVRSELPLDVVYVAREADVDTMGLSVESVRKFLRHPVSSFVVVGDENSRLPEFARDNGLRFVPENEVIGLRRTDISYTVDDVDRSGWMFQQLLKFGAAKLASGSHYLVMDADTILLKPQVYQAGGRDLVLHSDEFHVPYFLTYGRLTGREPVTYTSSVSHQALINRNILGDLQSFLERKWHKPWFRAILDVVDYDNASGFSEYETYAQWALENFGGKLHREHFRNLAMARSKALERGLDSLAQEFGDSYRSLSMHWYL
ncbi:DUF6492 family protein [Asticcacaulis sp. AND118]|uniref:DUF6492 family protein n=1 Tax=Asticcacaulis sp. AND118 TaxID=2840468 RepID=UPI001CFFCC3A|nr:DUF6492 family protein [Asticcacaulis sp. AND118]UDF03390.1 DUF6492 family protein [Asticcacaulis sp. AND118]